MCYDVSSRCASAVCSQSVNDERVSASNEVGLVRVNLTTTVLRDAHVRRVLKRGPVLTERVSKIRFREHRLPGIAFPVPGTQFMGVKP